MPGDVLASGGWIEDLGLVFDEAGGSRVSAHLNLTGRHHTPWGVVHGGVYTTIVETVGSVGASLAVEDRGEFAVGVNNSTDFIRSATGGRVDVVATPVQQGRVQQLWDVLITRAEDGKHVAQGRLRLQNVPLPTTQATERRSHDRADELLPEERTAGSDDATRQAGAILAESDARSDARETGATGAEHRTSDETVEPGS